MIPTTNDFLARLEASPADAASFDRATRRERPHCTTRREAVEATLEAVRARQAENEILKQKIAATKTRLAALEAAKLSQSNFMKNAVTTPPTLATQPTTAPAAKLTTAEDYQRSIAPPTMKRTEFSKLTPIQRNQWIRDGGKLV